MPNNLGIHEANRYEVNAKYGDVISVDEVLGYLEKVNQVSGARTWRLPLPARNIESALLGLLQYARGGE